MMKLTNQAEQSMEVASALNNCGARLHQSGRVREGLLRYQEAVELRIESLVRNELLVEKGVFYISPCQPSLRIVRSLDVFQDLEDSRPVSISDPIETDGTRSDVEESATLLYNMGVAHYELGNTNKGVKLFEMVLDVTSDGYLEAKILNCLAEIKIPLEPTSAMTLLTKALLIQQQLLKASCRSNELDRCVAITISLMARIKFLNGSYSHSLDLCREALRLRKICYGDGSIQVAANLFNMGLLQKTQGRLHEAFEHVSYFIKRCNIENEPQWLPQLAMANQVAGATKLEMRESDSAVEYFTRALELRMLVYEPKHIHIAETLTSLGRAYFGCGRLHLALCHYKEALNFQLQPEHAATIKCYVGHVYHHMDDSEMALESYRNALDQALVAEDMLPENISNLMVVIGNLLRQQGHPAEAETYFAEAATIPIQAEPNQMLPPKQIFSFLRNFPPAAPAA